MKNVILFFILFLTLTNIACEKKQNLFEKTGEKMDQGIEKTGDKIDEGLDKAGDKVKDATE